MGAGCVRPPANSVPSLEPAAAAHGGSRVGPLVCLSDDSSEALVISFGALTRSMRTEAAWSLCRTHGPDFAHLAHPKGVRRMSRARAAWHCKYGAAAVAALVSWCGVMPEAHAARKLSLAEAIALAKSQRPESARADLDLKIADVEILRAALQRVRLTANVSYSDGLQRVNVGASDDQCASIPGACTAKQHEQLLVGTANLSIPIWSGMSVEASWTRAHRLAAAADANRRATWANIAVETASAYWSVRRAELLLETERKARERNYQIMLVTKARADAGIAPQVDYARARTSVLRQEAGMSGLQGRAEQARAELGAALHVDGEIVLTEMPPESAEPRAVAQLLTDAEKRRPELQAAQATWEATE